MNQRSKRCFRSNYLDIDIYYTAYLQIQLMLFCIRLTILLWLTMINDYGFWSYLLNSSRFHSRKSLLHPSSIELFLDYLARMSPHPMMTDLTNWIPRGLMLCQDQQEPGLIKDQVFRLLLLRYICILYFVFLTWISM